MKEIIFSIIEKETEFETRLDLLTSIAATTSSEEVFKACEELRNELVNQFDQEENHANP